MKLEVNRMKSKKPFISRELIYNNLKRFWWICALYTLALFLVSPLITLTNGTDVIPERGYNINFWDIFSGTTLFLFTVQPLLGYKLFDLGDDLISWILLISINMATRLTHRCNTR